MIVCVSIRVHVQYVRARLCVLQKKFKLFPLSLWLIVKDASPQSYSVNSEFIAHKKHFAI